MKCLSVLTILLAFGCIGLPSAAIAQEPLTTFKDCDVCPEMVVIPAGSFMMGSNDFNEEKPIHRVTIRKPFAVGKYAVTFREWDACTADGGCKGYRPHDEGWGRGDRPVINVNWKDAQAYLRWLSRKSGAEYRLLSEAEWEYAARAGTTTRYYWGDKLGSGNANCRVCGSQWDAKQTAPVGSFRANAFGLYDVLGNVWEWVEDCYHSSYTGAPSDGGAWTSGDCSERVLRGGTWASPPWYVRSTFRRRGRPEHRVEFRGIRVARTLP